MARSFVFPRINLATLRAAVRNISERGSAGMKDATFAAAKGSPLLSAAIAAEYPFTFCPQPGCDLPIAHVGSPCLAG